MQWLQQNPEYSQIVQSIWTNVKVASLKTPTQQEAEYDVLLVLKNAVLVHLECKTPDTPLKELDARLLKLRLTSSDLAVMAIVAPIYTNMAKAPWFEGMHKLRERVTQATRFKFVPMTFPGQPQSYTHKTPKTSVPVEVPSFEQAMNDLFKRYLS